MGGLFEHAHPLSIRRLLVLSLVLVAVALAGAADSDRATAQEATFTPKAEHAILMDADTGAVLYQHAADDLTPPASMSKLMTLAVVFKALRDGVIKPADEITMSENAWRTGGAPSQTSAMFVPINEKVTVEELLQGILVQSGNDAC
ncbi:MAG: D-alanyl-D-alanine carboxypeptidase, partial [Caldilineaceae bacterium]|nr:D-alanyl-D-alanine carboxypeptidase [Caldilineaceae bacterium]